MLRQLMLKLQRVAAYRCLECARLVQFSAAQIRIFKPLSRPQCCMRSLGVDTRTKFTSNVVTHVFEILCARWVLWVMKSLGLAACASIENFDAT